MTDDTEITRTSIKHAYQQVADAIAARIATGYYTIKLRSERDLAEEFSVSYITARHATAILRQRGLIVSIHGRGTFVASALAGYQPDPPPVTETSPDEPASEKDMAPGTPTNPGDETNNTDLVTALRNAEQFLLKSGEAIHPNLSERTLLRYLTQYRTHLHAVVTSAHRDQGPAIDHPA
jgi:GntR family transcriptional regulator